MTDYITYTIYPKFVCPSCHSSGDSLTYDGFYLIPSRSVSVSPLPKGYDTERPFSTSFEKSYCEFLDKAKRWYEETYKPMKIDDTEVSMEGKIPYGRLLDTAKEWMTCAYCGRTRDVTFEADMSGTLERLLSGSFVKVTCSNPVHDGAAEQFGASPFDDDAGRHIRDNNVCIKIRCQCGRKFLVSKEALKCP